MQLTLSWQPIMINDPDSNTTARINTEARRRFRCLSKRLMAKISQKLISTPYQLMKQFVNRSIYDTCVRPNQRIYTHNITPTTTLSLTPFNDTARLTVSVMPFRDIARCCFPWRIPWRPRFPRQVFPWHTLLTVCDITCINPVLYSFFFYLHIKGY